jgi:Fe-S-cluster containining protein
MQCRAGCGACCTAPSISTSFYGMPQGKPAGVTCIHLTRERLCGLFGDSRRPAVCKDFQAEYAVCGDDRETALVNLQQLEILSRPD